MYARIRSTRAGASGSPPTSAAAAGAAGAGARAAGAAHDSASAHAQAHTDADAHADADADAAMPPVRFPRLARLTVVIVRRETAFDAGREPRGVRTNTQSTDDERQRQTESERDARRRRFISWNFEADATGAAAPVHARLRAGRRDVRL